MSRKSHKRLVILLPVCIGVAVIVALVWFVKSHTIAVLDPAGQIGLKERRLMVIALSLSAIVVIPVYIMAIAIAVKYRESNQKAKYNPDWDKSRLFESLWWGIPIVIIGILSVITWQSSHSLDPYRPLASSARTLDVQVVAMDWKWLFIYPQQHVASVNLVEFPKNMPVDFSITSDSIMNSFWIPQLGGQIYAMTGMKTHLNLEADRTGNFFGTPANIAGQGFAYMDFTAKSVTNKQFASWLATASKASKSMDFVAYNQLAKPSQDNPTTLYSNADPALFDSIIKSYAGPNAMEMADD